MRNLPQLQVPLEPQPEGDDEGTFPDLARRSLTYEAEEGGGLEGGVGGVGSQGSVFSEGGLIEEVEQGLAPGPGQGLVPGPAPGQGRSRQQDQGQRQDKGSNQGYERPGGVMDQSWVSAGYDSQEESLTGLGSPVKKDGSIDSLTKVAVPPVIDGTGVSERGRGAGSVHGIGNGSLLDNDSITRQGLGPSQGQGLGQGKGQGLGQRLSQQGSVEEGMSVYVQGQGLSQAQLLGLGSSVEEGTSVYVQGPGLSQAQGFGLGAGAGLGTGFGAGLGLGSVEEGASVYVTVAAPEALTDPTYWDQYKVRGNHSTITTQPQHNSL